MADPTISSSLTALQPIAPLTTAYPASKATAAPGKDFKDYLLQSLEKVNQLQTEADAGVQKLMTGQTDNVAEVFTATRKAGIAFDLLMEIRNKLMEAYTELRQMRV
jgi:flagellar hook-basal body complex protein FliE